MLRESVRALDPDVPIDQIQTMTQIDSRALAPRRFQTMLVLSFAAAGLFLAALGTYSVIAYSVSRRRHEIGIRMAMGARPRHALTMILHQGLKPVLIGLSAGILAAVVFGRLLSTLLFSVSATEPSTFVVVAAITVLAAFGACWIPANRAAKIAPLEALRYE